MIVTHINDPMSCGLMTICGVRYEDIYNNGNTSLQPEFLDLDRTDLCNVCVERMRIVRRIMKLHK